MDRPEWTSRAKTVEAVCLDVGFLLAESFYYGPENGFTHAQWQQLREPLYQPRVERYGDFVLSAELGETADELVLYYRDVLRMVAHHQKEIGRQSHHFWMRPLIFARGQFAMTFPWYDTWGEAAHLLDALSAERDGWVFSDIDQGWEFQASAEGDRLFLRQSDPDNGEEHFVIAADRGQLGGQIPVVRQRVTGLLRELTAALGRDLWSRRW
jgi:hypothetical protein